MQYLLLAASADPDRSRPVRPVVIVYDGRCAGGVCLVLLAEASSVGDWTLHGHTGRRNVATAAARRGRTTLCTEAGLAATCHPPLSRVVRSVGARGAASPAPLQRGRGRGRGRGRSRGRSDRPPPSLHGDARPRSNSSRPSSGATGRAAGRRSAGGTWGAAGGQRALAAAPV